MLTCRLFILPPNCQIFLPFLAVRFTARDFIPVLILVNRNLALWKCSFLWRRMCERVNSLIYGYLEITHPLTYYWFLDLMYGVQLSD